MAAIKDKLITAESLKYVHDKVNDQVIVSDEQPTSPNNRIWINETSDGGVQVPTYEEFVELENDVDELKEDLSDVYEAIGSTEMALTWEQGGFNTTTWAEADNSRAIRTSELTPSASNIFVTLSANYRYRVIWYDLTQTVTGGSSWIYTSGVLNVSSSSYFRIMLGKNPAADIIPSDGNAFRIKNGEYNNDIERNTKNIEEVNNNVTIVEFLQENTSIAGFNKTYTKTDLIHTATVTTGKFRTPIGDTTSSVWNYYEAGVTTGDILSIKGMSTGTAYLWYMYDSSDNIVSYYPSKITGSVTGGFFVVPEDAVKIVVNQRVSDDFEFAELFGCIYSDPNQNTKLVTAVKSGNDLQFRSAYETKVMAISATVNGSQNGGFNLSNYYLLDSEPAEEATIATGTLYKGAGDDICPIHYNGSYVGANHGKSPTWKLTLASHGLTTADIGSVWSSNSKQYVIYRIDDTDKFSVIGDTDNSYYDVVTTAPVAPLTHVSGATHTGNLAFTASVSQQVYPAFKNYALSIKNESGTALSTDGVIKGNKITIEESYDIFDVASVVEYLKTNVGSNTNTSYYSDSIDANMRIRNTYTFLKDGAMTVSCNAIPLKEGVYLEYWGGVQSGTIGDNIYVPFTSYNSIQAQSGTVNLTSETWDDDQFPAYKLYQFDGSGNGFATGYVIDYGQGLPATRYSKLTGANGAGFYYSSSKKMYPHFYDVALGTDFYGNYLSFYAFRCPVKNVSNFAKAQYEIEDTLYIEAEFFASQYKTIEVGEKYNNRKITVVKKDSSISVMSDTVVCGQIDVSASASGSLTLKIEK